MRFSDVGWTDITATTAVATTILEALGYETKVDMLAVPVTYASLARGDIDVFLGNWMPTMEAYIAPYREAGTVEVVRANLEGAKYTLAVSKSLADEGLKDFADIAKFADQLDNTIYGIEPGNDGNKLILDMIDKDAFGLGEFELKESSEQGDAGAGGAGAEERRGHRLPRLGAASDEQEPRDDLPDRRRRVLRAEPRRRDGLRPTSARAMSTECPNVGKFLQNLVFTLDMENEIMGAILDDGEDPADAAAGLAEGEPEALDAWLAGVTTRDGGDGRGGGPRRARRLSRRDGPRMDWESTEDTGRRHGRGRGRLADRPRRPGSSTGWRRGHRASSTRILWALQTPPAFVVVAVFAALAWFLQRSW